MHSTHSLDGNNSIAELCQQAVELGLTHIAVTDHVEWPPGGRHQRPDFDRYFDEIAAARARFAGQGLTVLSGRELGNPHEHRAETEDLLARYDFDVAIGSMHWLDGENIHFTRCFDGRDPYAVYARYFAQMADLARTVPCDFIAHFDRIFWPGTQRFGPPDVTRMEGPVRDALGAMAENGRVLELNTRFLTHDPSWNDSLLTVLRWYREAGGTAVAVNSDAHHCAQIGRNRAIGAGLVAEAGCVPYRWQGQRVPA